MDQASGLTEPILVADLGGTNARFAIAERVSPELANVVQFPCAAHHGPEAAIRSYLAQIDAKPEYASIAVAAPVTGDDIVFTNSVWSFTISALRRNLGFKHLFVLNDFEAFALALPSLGANEILQIGGIEPQPSGTKVAIGIGTGTGMAALVSSPSGWVVVPSEGGHASFAPHTAEEFALAERLRLDRSHLSVERVLSGPGLSALYRAVAASHGVEAEALVPNDVLTRALSRTDPIAVEVLTFFVRCLGRFAGDAALAFGARGGVYLGGGIAPRILDLLETGSFRDAFEDKGRMKRYLAPIPVYAVLAEHATLRGAAIGARSELASSRA
jgi:glucokinase